MLATAASIGGIKIIAIFQFFSPPSVVMMDEYALRPITFLLLP
jgi:hypothetical protein